MAQPKRLELIVFQLGSKGVNVDLNPTQLEDAHLRKAQNIISDPLGGELGLRNRPGLAKFNTNVASGPILGGISVPLQNRFTGNRFFYIGRGSKA